jgi:hypothetical protein
MKAKWIEMTDGSIIRWSDIRKVFCEIKSGHTYSYCETSCNEKLDFLDLTDVYIFCIRVGDERGLYASEVVDLHRRIIKYIEQSDCEFFVLLDIYIKETELLISDMN